jgi:hypothetical protein
VERIFTSLRRRVRWQQAAAAVRLRGVDDGVDAAASPLAVAPSGTYIFAGKYLIDLLLSLSSPCPRVSLRFLDLCPDWVAR